MSKLPQVRSTVSRESDSIHELEQIMEEVRRKLVVCAREIVPHVDIPDSADWPELKVIIQTIGPEFDDERLEAAQGQVGEFVEEFDELYSLVGPYLKLKRLRRSSGIGKELAEGQLLSVPNGEAYHHAQRALADPSFFTRTDESDFPTACMQGGKGGMSMTKIQLRPDTVGSVALQQEQALILRMWEQSRELSDLDADSLDAMMAIWIKSAKSLTDDAVAHVDDLLAMRDLQKKDRGQGRRSGYTPRQRAEIVSCLSRLQDVWVEFQDGASKGGRSEIVRSRAVTITDLRGQLQMDGGMDVNAFIFRPGAVFARYMWGEGRQTTLLSVKALKYNPYTQGHEKKLTRYLAWQWRIRARSGNYGQGFTVKTLLDESGIAIDERRPHRAQARLEKALDQLQADNVINNYDYDKGKWNEESDGGVRGWLRKWMASIIFIEAPDMVKDHYRKHGLEIEALPIRKKIPAAATIGQRLALVRKEKGFSQAFVAETLQITQPYLSMIEAGKMDKLGQGVQAKIENWLRAFPTNQA